MSGQLLTVREQQVLDRLVTYGETYKVLATLFNCSPRTIEQHIRNIMNKTGVRNKRDLMGVHRRDGAV